jgi:hypothetical protein
MTNFKLVFEIEIDSDSPINAAKKVQEWLREGDYQWYVQNDEGRIFSVDLAEEDEDAVLQVNSYKPLIDEL